MKIQTKTLTIILCSFLIISPLLYFSLNKIITKGFLEIEVNNVHSDLQRTLNLIKIEQDTLDLLTADWAVWDDSYEFIKEPNQKYIKSNLVEATFADYKLSFIAYINKSGKIIFAKAYDANNEKLIPLTANLLQHLQPGKALLQPNETGKAISGVISLLEGAFYVSSIPILTSNETGPSQGLLIMGKSFDKSFVEYLSKNLNFDISVFSYQKLNPELSAISGRLDDSNKFTVLNNSKERNSGYSFISDIYDKPSLLIKIDVGRPIYQQGNKTIYLMMVSIFIIMLILVVLVYVLMQVIILSRLSKLSGQVDIIQHSKEKKEPIHGFNLDKKNNDEIDNLAHSINNMLATIYESNQGLENAKEVAEAALKTKSVFLSIINHELRTPLHVIVAYTDLLSKTELGGKQRKYVDSILSGSSSLMSIINDVLDYSKIESGQLNIEKKNMKLFLFLDEIQSMFELILSEKGLNFKLSISNDTPDNIFMDEYRLKQILLNLLNNAVKFTEQGGVELVVESLPSAKPCCFNLCFKVKDSGIGIPEENQETIFNQFVQQDGQDTRKYGGTGLGLAICQKIAYLLNGDVSVSSTLGKGSTFTLMLYDVKTTNEHVL